MGHPRKRQADIQEPVSIKRTQRGVKEDKNGSDESVRMAVCSVNERSAGLFGVRFHTIVLAGSLFIFGEYIANPAKPC